MQSQIAIAKQKPGFAPDLFQGFHEIPGLASSSPSALQIALATQRIKNRVEIRRDMKTKMFEIVSHIHNDRQTFAEHVLQAEGKFRSSDAAA